MKENWYCLIFGHNFKNVYDEKITDVDANSYAKMVKAVSDEMYYQSDKIELIEEIPTQNIEKTHIKTYCKRCGKIV